MILAGGRGTELSVLTAHRAKTSVPFGGRYRIVDFCLSNCVHSGLTDIAVLAQYSPASLMEHIRMGKPWDLDRRAGGVYILQPSHHGEAANWYLGTADALYQNAAVIRNSEADAVLVLSGDQVYRMDYRKLVSSHAESGRPATLVCKHVTARQRGRFGMVSLSPKGIVREFEEKPERSELDKASLGIYLFDRKYLLGLLDSGRKDIVFDLLIPEIRKRHVGGYLFEGYWEDIGSIPSYFKASMRLLRNRDLIAADDWPVFTRGGGLPAANFCPSAEVSDSIVAEGCRIEGRVTGSILFPGVTIDKGVEIEDCIVFSGTRFGRGGRIRRTIVDKNVTVGKDARIGIRKAGRKDAWLAGSGVCAKDVKTGGISVIGKNSVIAGGTDLPESSIILPEKNVRGRSR
ncbi:MAG TPA: sugar phosphate nucleotidyltransferase [Candidatus Krumholzibacterium sp.]|nr:sugar phosphate nucleotidyltransferase [Candidatus Krumholzibacterium sp.]